MYTVNPRPSVSMQSCLQLLLLAVTLVLATMPLQRSANLPSLTTSTSRMSIIAPDFGKLPLSFEPIAGQTAPGVQFQVHGLGGMIYFMQREVALSVPRIDHQQSTASQEPTTTKYRPKDSVSEFPKMVRLRFEGTSPISEVVGAEKLPGIVNYFIGNDPAKWRTHLPTYAGIIYKGLYPGIDLRYDGTGGQLKGTYSIVPGADPTRIRWRYEGAMSVRIDEVTGDIHITPSAVMSDVAGNESSSSTPTLIERAPVAWQDINGQQAPVSARYVIFADGSVGFALGMYDSSRPLIVDPTLIYSSYTGSNGLDEGHGIVVDRQSNVFITGTTTRSDVGNNTDVFVTKLNSNGGQASRSYVGGSNNDEGNDIVVDSDGNAYVTGITISADFPRAGTPPQPDPGGIGCLTPIRGNPCFDAFVFKLNTSIDMLTYSTYLGGNDDDRSRGITIDSARNIYVTGSTQSTDFPTTPGAFRTGYIVGTCGNAAFGPCSNAFVTKLNADGSAWVYSTYLGGSSGDGASDVALDSNNNAYIVGSTWSDDFPIFNGIPNVQGGNGDVYVTELNSAGNGLVYSTRLGGTNMDLGAGIGLDNLDNAYITGLTRSQNFPTEHPLYGPDSSTNETGLDCCTDAFVAKLSATGNTLIYSTYLSGGNADFGSGIAVDSTGYAYITGQTNSSNFPNKRALQNGYSSATCGPVGRRYSCYDAFLTTIDPNGTSLVYSTYLGGIGDDEASSIAVDSAASVYITGATTGDFPCVSTTPCAYLGGARDAFVTKISDTLLPPTDLVATGLEVTQGVQNLYNQVPLVAGKRTFVRFYVQSRNGYRWTYAHLHVRKGAQETIVKPINSINVSPQPHRDILYHAFLFELPNNPIDYTVGEVSLTAEVNPITDWGVRVPETDYSLSSNTISKNIAFEVVPPVNLVLYKVGYGPEEEPIYPSQFHLDRLSDWLRQAFPVDTLNIKQRSFYKSSSMPSCRDVNASLQIRMNMDTSELEGTRYYGMMDDDGNYKPASCAADSPSFVASGWTGTPQYGNGIDYSWDTDGSYGDIEGGHEIAHMYGRYHAEFCGALAFNDRNLNGVRDPGEEYPPNYIPYPHPQGRISDYIVGSDAFYGFNIDTKAIYGPQWHDMMSYCPERWISDFNYKGLMEYFQRTLAFPVASRLQNQVDRLLVVGSIDATTKQATIQPLFVIPSASDLEQRVPGEYAIALRSAFGNVLARYPFTPEQISDINSLFISELVPYVVGTMHVDIEGPGGILLKRISAGTAQPTITVTAPNGGETLTGDPITVSWIASDPDNDPLTFHVQYSPDNGITWETVAQNVTENSVKVDPSNIVAGTRSRFRVWVSDGIHTTSDISDASFTVPNRVPTAQIIEPSSDVTIAAGETLGLVGKAYDVDTGTMDDARLEWRSNIDGLLGHGDRVSINSLSIGTHTLTFRADDGAGGMASDTIEVTVVANPTQMPAMPDKLRVDPEPIIFDAEAGQTSAQLFIDNQNGDMPITWNAVTNAPWVQLGSNSGTTPNSITITLNEAQLPKSTQTATITLTSPDTPGDSTTVHVTFQAAPNRLWLPIVANVGTTTTPPPPPPAADLVGSFSIKPDKRNFRAGDPLQITAVITNQGTVATDPVWVDLFINPSVPPTAADIPTRWNDRCGMEPCFGIAWAVQASLAPGESITLTSTVESYDPAQTIWPGWFARGTRDLYLYVDSWNPGVVTGAVAESDETNNRAELHVNVTGQNPRFNVAQADNLGPRPTLGTK